MFWNDNYVSDGHLSRWNAPWMNAPDGGWGGGHIGTRLPGLRSVYFERDQSNPD